MKYLKSVGGSREWSITELWVHPLFWEKNTIRSQGVPNRMMAGIAGMIFFDQFSEKRAEYGDALDSNFGLIGACQTFFLLPLLGLFPKAILNIDEL